MMHHHESLHEERWSYARWVNDRHVALAKLGGSVGCAHCSNTTFYEGEEIFAHQRHK